MTFDEFKIEKNEIISQIRDGAVFIYPTDTIYGIGCNALVSDSVKKIRKLKGRTSNPFSVIAPSIDWIRENCAIGKESEEWIGKLPGPYTLILRVKNKKCVSKNVNPGLSTIGVRIPNHWISQMVSESGIPLVTTSVNKRGEEYMTSLEDMDSSIGEAVEFILYEGQKKGKPSKIVDLAGNTKVIER